MSHGQHSIQKERNSSHAAIAPQTSQKTQKPAHLYQREHGLEDDAFQGPQRAARQHRLAHVLVLTLDQAAVIRRDGRCADGRSEAKEEHEQRGPHGWNLVRQPASRGPTGGRESFDSSPSSTVGIGLVRSAWSRRSLCST